MHYPTDINLLYDATRCLIRTTSRVAQEYRLSGWRKHKHHARALRRAFNSLRGKRKGVKWERRVKDYLSLCGELVKKSEVTVG